MPTSYTLQPGETLMISTGIAIAVPSGYFGMLVPRSGLGSKYGLVLGNGTGIIDSDYRGELKVCLWNRSEVTYAVAPHERIAQLILAPTLTGSFDEVTSFTHASDRGEAGFCSTGRS